MADKGRPLTEEEQKILAQRITPPNDQAKGLQDAINASKGQEVKGVSQESERNLGYVSSKVPQNPNRDTPANYRARERVMEQERQKGQQRPPTSSTSYNQTQVNVEQGLRTTQQDRFLKREIEGAEPMLDRDLHEKTKHNMEERLKQTKEPDKGQNQQKSKEKTQDKDRDNER